MTGIEAVAIAGAVASAAAGAASAVSAGNQRAAQAKTQAAATAYNAAQQRAQAEVQLSNAEAEASRGEDLTRRRLASAANAMGASGVQAGGGSGLDLMADLAAEGALDAEITRWRGRQGAISSERQAQALDWQSGIQGAQAKAEKQAGNMQAATTLLTQGARIYGGTL